MKITAAQNKVFRRISDGFIMGFEITLGVDYSTGVARQDLPEYYEQIDDDSTIDDTEALNIILDRDEQSTSI